MPHMANLNWLEIYFFSNMALLFMTTMKMNKMTMSQHMKNMISKTTQTWKW